jgi:hypothetical protein
VWGTGDFFAAHPLSALIVSGSSSDVLGLPTRRRCERYLTRNRCVSSCGWLFFLKNRFK